MPLGDLAVHDAINKRISDTDTGSKYATIAPVARLADHDSLFARS